MNQLFHETPLLVPVIGNAFKCKRTFIESTYIEEAKIIL
jgi:hypothetical protein